MIHFRPFHNNDTPLLVDVWRSQPSQRGLMQPMSSTVFESAVLAKPFFDAAGLIVATDGGKALGFVHAGFGPNENLSDLSTERGAVCLLLVQPTEVDSALPGELLAQGEAFLASHGAKLWYGGGLRPVAPFYLGLSGGSEISGVLDSNRQAQELYSSHHYSQCLSTTVLQLDLTRFRPLVDRQQMQMRRQMTFHSILDPPTRNWWEACTYGAFDRIAFELRMRDRAEPVARVMFWAMQPLAGAWGVNALGLVDLEVSTSVRRHGAGSYLLGEALRQLHQQGISLIETHVRQDNSAALALFRKLGFEPVDRAIAYCKAPASEAT